MGLIKEMNSIFEVSDVFDLVRKAARKHTYKLREQGRISFSEPKAGDVPSIYVARRTLPEVWEDMNVALLGIGQTVHTHYDPGHEKGKYESFPSMEATGIMHIEEPFGEPRFHKNFLGGYLGFGDYKAEIEGLKDSWVLNPAIVVDLLKKGKFDTIKDYKSWLYSYSQRIRAYPYIDIEGKPQVINQLNSVVANLTNLPISRSAQCVTWDPRFDHNDGQMDYIDKDGKKQRAVFDDYHAPCLQRLWFRVIPFEDGFKLNANTHWRSRDHPKAVPANIYGVTEGMIEHVRKSLEEALGVPVKMGRYVDINDSLHLYGHYYDERRGGVDATGYLEDILRVIKGEPIENRLIIPGTMLYDVAMEEIGKEYKLRIENPNYGRNMEEAVVVKKIKPKIRTIKFKTISKKTTRSQKKDKQKKKI